MRLSNHTKFQELIFRLSLCYVPQEFLMFRKALLLQEFYLVVKDNKHMSFCQCTKDCTYKP